MFFTVYYALSPHYKKQQNTPKHNVKQELKGYSIIYSGAILDPNFQVNIKGTVIYCDKSQLLHIVFNAESIYTLNFLYFRGI